MGQAKLRKAEIEQLKNPLLGIKPVTDTDTEEVKKIKEFINNYKNEA